MQCVITFWGRDVCILDAGMPGWHQLAVEVCLAATAAALLSSETSRSASKGGPDRPHTQQGCCSKQPRTLFAGTAAPKLLPLLLCNLTDCSPAACCCACASIKCVTRSSSSVGSAAGLPLQLSGVTSTGLLFVVSAMTHWWLCSLSSWCTRRKTSSCSKVGREWGVQGDSSRGGAR